MVDKLEIDDQLPDAGQGPGPADAFRFVSGPKERGKPYLAPDVPPYFVPRTEFFALKRQLTQNGGGLLYPLTMHGPAGSGKTSLAAALAHDSDVLEAFPDGVLWVSLADGEDPQGAQRQWGEALGNDLAHQPDTNARAAALRALLKDARCLLILDNVTDVEQVRALNVSGPKCVRLVTTRDLDTLGTFKTRRYAITKLREDEAISLLSEWAGILPDIYLPTVKEIITRLCNSALALALVGGQARQGITWLRLLEVLRDDQGPLAMLRTDDAKVRNNALGLIVNIVLARFGSLHLKRTALLGAFSGGMGAAFSLDAAAACWGIPLAEARGTADLLVEAAVLQRLPGSYLVVHEALREHLRRMATPVELLEASGRIRSHYVALLEGGGDTPTVDAQLGQIIATYHLAAEQDAMAAAVLGDALMGFFERRGLWSYFVRLACDARDAARSTGDVNREHVVISDLGYAYTILGDLGEAQACFKRGLDISKSLGDTGGEANALNNLGAIAERQRDYELAEDYYRSSLALRQQLGVREDIASTMNNLAGVLFWQRRWEEALNTFERVLDMVNALNDRAGQAQTWLNIGASHESLGDDYEALQAYHRSLASYGNLGDEAGQAQALNNIGIVYLNRGETERALDHFKRSLALKEKLNDEPGQALTLNNMAMLYERTGSLHLALEHYERSYRLLKALDDPRAEVVQDNIQVIRVQLQHNEGS